LISDIIVEHKWFMKLDDGCVGVLYLSASGRVSR
jgi:hypothetical protein